MTGNDIVDLNLARVPCSEKRVRFIEKIFTSREQEIIESGKAGIWSLWAMKEAVYKAHHRRFNLQRSFDPKTIEISMQGTSRILARAQYRGYEYFGKGIFSTGYLHFTATCFPQEKIHLEIHPSSADIHTKLLKVVSVKLNLDIRELCIKKNKNFIPVIYLGNTPLSLPFSVSHHGKFAAFSMQLMNY